MLWGKPGFPESSYQKPVWLWADPNPLWASVSPLGSPECHFWQWTVNPEGKRGSPGVQFGARVGLADS